MLRYLSVFLLSALCFTQAQAQYTNVLIDDINDPEEPSININPKNPSELVAGSNINNVYYSHDGGATWTKNQLSSQWGVWGDPCIVTDTLDHFYFFHLSWAPTGSWIDRIVCQRSDDAGQTWTVDSYTGLNGSKDQDKAWGVFDHSAPSAYKGNLYVTWTEFDEYSNPDPAFKSRIQFSRSTDLGVSWSTPLTISQFTGDCIDEDHTAEGAVPCVGPNGEVYVSWALNDTIYFDRSTDGGNTWLANDVVAATQPGGWDYSISGHDRCNGLPITAIDLSGGTHNGRIYINWSDQRNGPTDTDVWTCYSDDSGNTWSAPVRVNNDAPGKQNYLSWMCVDQSTGFVYVVFYDRRNYPGNQTDVCVAISMDGGVTYQNQIVSASPFLPSSSAFFGDYTNIAAVNGHVRPIWARMDNTASSVWTALMEVTASLNDAPFQFNTQVQVHPNPMQAQAIFQITCKEPTTLALKIYDISGRMVADVFAGRKFSSGTNDFSFENDHGTLQPGMYLAELSSSTGKRTIRLQIAE